MYKNLIFKLCVFISAVALVVLFIPEKGQFNYQFEKNFPWKYGQLIATFDFPIYKSEEIIRKEKDSIMKQYRPYFHMRSDIGQKNVNALNTYLNRNSTINVAYKQHVLNLLRELYTQGIVSNKDAKQLQADSIQQVMIIEDNQATAEPSSRFMTVKKAYEYIINADTTRFSKTTLQQINLNNYISPNLSFDEKKSLSAQNDLTSSISFAKGMVLSGQKIIDRGEIVDENTYNILLSLNKEIQRRNEASHFSITTICGQILFVSLILSALMLYLHLFRVDYFDRRQTILLLFGLTIFFPIVTSIMVKHNIFSVYMLPLTMAPMIIRVFMDSRTAFIAHILMITLCSIVLRYPYEFIILQITGGLSAIYSLRELSQRSQLLRSAFIVFATYLLTFFSLQLTHETDLSKIDFSMVNYLIANGIFLLFTYPLLFIFEKLFGFTSNVTLVELSNINNSLLHKMSEEAPGTFQHSMQVANLAAEAANRVGAKSQLVRTGALYHDIGKLYNPAFFTENQAGVNPHTHLTYEQSAQIIIGHVTEGLKLADKNNLPKVIRDFICTHHGKGKTKYFYISYKNEHPNEECDESKFTYPGPNPFTREQAILMMADSVEAASRSIGVYTEESISTLVDKIIDSQMNDGAFLECPITFKDILTCKTVFKEKLKTIYHTRISYPELKSSEPQGTQPTGSISK